MDPDLPGREVEFIALLRRGGDDALRIVGGDAVRDDDDVERFDGFDVVPTGFAFAEVGFQDFVEFVARGRAATWSYGVEDPLHLAWGRDVAVGGVVFGVEEVDVYAVFVVGGADGRDGCQRGAGLAPVAAGHGAGVVDYEDGVEVAEEGVGAVCRWCDVGGWG